MNSLKNVIRNNTDINSCDMKAASQSILKLDLPSNSDFDFSCDLLSPKSNSSVPLSSSNNSTATATATSRSILYSSDDEYKTASEGNFTTKLNFVSANF